MSQVKKLQQGGQTPDLYSFYGKQYDYNDLAQTADQGLNEYLLSLKRGEKDQTDFRDAYSNIMAGIKDGTITFDNGRFYDSQGRYTNSDKKNKDYYGLIANYIYGKMGKSKVYEKPVDTSKISWEDGGIRKALMQELFNSDTGNIKNFLDLDQENNGVRSLTNRANYLANAFQSIANNWDNTFQGYQDSDKERYVTLLNNAATALRDGKIDPGDYLALSKAAGGMDFREMMATGTPTKVENPQQTQSKPTIKTKRASLVDENFDPRMLSQMSSVMARVPTRSLIGILRNSFYNRHYNFGYDRRIQTLFGTPNISSKAGITATLNALQTQGKLRAADPENPNLFYIPGLRTKRGTGWVWDKANNTVTEMLLENIPYAKAKLNPTYKNGGVLFAGSGAKFYEGFKPFDQSGYQRTWGDKAYRINENGEYEEGGYSIPGVGINNNRYKSDPNYSDFSKEGRERAAAIENTENYKNFTQRLLDGYNAYMNATDKSTQTRENNAFINYTRGYDAKQTNPELRFWDGDNLRTEWTASGNDYYGQPGQKIVGADKRITHLRTDNIIGGGHDNYRASGKRYFYKDEDGTTHWVDPKEIESGKYTMKEGVKTTEGDTDWTDYELTGLANPKTGEGTEINKTTPTEKKPSFWDKGLKAIQDLAPLAVGAGRLFDSLNTNNRVAKTVRDSMKPTLKDTYETYSPVTGAFSEMQFRNRQAADLRRQAAQPYTSDASLNAARSLDANRQANNLEYQGFLADDKEIQRTKNEALLRQEDNAKRRSEVDNYNREAFNNNEMRKAYLEADRLKSNWLSRDNFLGGIESDLKYKKAVRDQELKDQQELFKSQEEALDRDKMNYDYNRRQEDYKTYYSSEYNKLKDQFDRQLEDWQKVNGENSDYTKQQFYLDFDTKSKSLMDEYNKKRDELYNEQLKNKRDYIAKAKQKVSSYPYYSKKGGKLSLSTINLLNKIVK